MINLLHQKKITNNQQITPKNRINYSASLFCAYVLAIKIFRYNIKLMDKNRQATDIDRKLAIYYHPLFQEVIKNILLLFKIPEHNTFEIGLLQFVEFNLKLQKSLLPSFETQNALVSALNDWVKEVAQCLSYEGMVSTSKCQQITPENFSSLLEKELAGIYIKPFSQKQQYIKTLIRLGTHDAFKLLGVKINKQVFNKFMFDLCSTWCEFLDIQLFSYFLIAIYIQLSEGQTIQKSQFKKTSLITTIDLEFMEEFEEIKATYSKNRKKDLRYYRAWCQWNYLRINEVGQSLILQLDQIHENDPRILQLALIFEKAIQVINDEITNQNQVKQVPTLPFQVSKTQEKEGEFLVARKIGVAVQKQRRQSSQRQISKQSKLQQQVETEDQIIHNFQIQIDAEGNMYLRKVVKLPILGTKIELEPYDRKILVKMRYLQRKKQEIRQISNLYRRMENMKVRLEHNVKNDPYNYKEMTKIAQRDEFYAKQQADKQKQIKNQHTNLPVDKIIHGKIQPYQEPAPIPKDKQQYKQLFKAQLLQSKEPIRKNQDYIHKVMAPSFLTDNKNNAVYSNKGESSIYGVGPYAQKRDIKLGLPKIKHLNAKMQTAKQPNTYHIIGKLVKDRTVINQRIKSFSTTTQPPLNKLQKEREEFKHVWHRYISEEQMSQLTDYNDFYAKLQQAKKQFSKDHQSQYRVNLKQILLYDNKRYQMGGVIDRKQEEKFYQRIRKLIRRDQRRQQKKKRRTRLREYRKAVGSKHNKKLFQDIFINYHRTAINQIKEDRKNASMSMAK